MTEEERKRIYEDFISKGIDISPFLFMSNTDKKYFFGMYEEYLQAMLGNDTEVIYDRYNDITVLKRDKVVCTFYITHNYKTLRINTEHSLDDEDLEVSITMMFLTVKELGSMIKALSKTFDKIANEDNDLGIGSNKKFVSTTNLPNNIKNTINKISQLQKSILSENKKYKAKRIKKDKEDK